MNKFQDNIKEHKVPGIGEVALRSKTKNLKISLCFPFNVQLLACLFPLQMWLLPPNFSDI